MPDSVTDDEFPLRLLRHVLPDWLTREGAIIDWTSCLRPYVQEALTSSGYIVQYSRLG
ncbi:MAG TPA: hypothetical protein VIR57_12910 [Chloroflexota bacterium]